MRITNVSADVNSQRSIRQQPVKIGKQVKGELYDAEKVEASDSETEAVSGDTTQAEQAGAADSGAEKATTQKKGRKTKRA